MKILYLASAADWHIALWTKYFTRSHAVTLFSDREPFLAPAKYDRSIEIVEHDGWLSPVVNRAGRYRRHWMAQANKLASVRRYAAAAADLVVSRQIEIIHAHSLYYGYLASFVRTAVPVVFTPMGSDVIVNAQRSRVFAHMARRAFRRADVVTGDSVLLQERGYNVGARRERNYIIQNGADSDLFRPAPSDVKQRLGLAADEAFLFSPRGLSPIYSIETIIHAVRLLVERGRKVKVGFVYALGDENLARLRSLTSSLGLDAYMIWIGRLEYEQMAEYYNAADVILSVPVSDSSPKSVYEAMFCERPTVVTDLPWSHEILGDDCVWRIPVCDGAALCEAVCQILDHPEQAKTIARTGARYARQHFDYADNMRRMEAIMARLVESPAGLPAGSAPAAMPAD